MGSAASSLVLSARSGLTLALVAAFALTGCAGLRTAPLDTAAAQRSAGVDARATAAGDHAYDPPAADPAGTEGLEWYEADDEPAAFPFAAVGGQPFDEPAFENLETLLIEDPVTASPLDDLAEVTPELSPDELEAELERVAEVVPTFDIPIEINDHVLAWVDRYSGNLKQSFEANLKRSGRYMDMFRDIFAETGVPRDLVYMAAVESGYKTSAYSRAHARGIFQFISATARRYGLRVDYWVDERSDPEKSARAAAAYIKDLHDEFDDWYLALAAYNAGEGKIRSAIRRSGQRDFWEIARRRFVRRETRNHVPAILAATLLSKEPEKYGLRYEPDPPLYYDSIDVAGAVDLRVLARCAETDVSTMIELNPALRRNQTPPDGTMAVRVPSGMGATTRAALDAVPPGARVLYARHRVERGDTLSVIARRHGVTVHAIQQANNLGRRTLIREKQVLRIPTSSSQYYAGDSPGGGDDGAGDVLTYRVRRGDNLSRIARRYGTNPASIAAASDIPVNKLLQIGERLQVVRGARSPSEARRIARGGSATPAAPTGNTSDALVHTVRSGDTLWHIASRYRTTVHALCSLNQISANSILRPGTRLTVGFK